MFDRVNEMQDKQDDAVVSLEGEKRRMVNMHTKHVKLLSTKLIKEALNRTIKRNRELAFE